LQPRMTRPQTKRSIKTSGLFLRGISTNLQPNDPLLIDFGKAGEAPTLLRVKQVVVDATNNRTHVTLQSWDDSQTQLPESESLESGDDLDTILRSLELPPSIPPPNALQLLRSPQVTFTANADVFPRLLATMRPRLSETLYPALQNAAASASQPIKVYALRAKAAPFGNNAPRKITGIDPHTSAVTTDEWNVSNMQEAGEQPNRIYLDASYEKILPDSWLVIDTSAVNEEQLGGVKKIDSYVIAQAKNPNAQLSRAVYGITGKTTFIELVDNRGEPTKWFNYVTSDGPIGLEAVAPPPPDDFQIIRRTAVYAQSEELALAEESVQDDICHGDTNWIELDSLYADLNSGRRAIVSGERTDIKIPDPNDSTKQVSIPGIKASELVMLTDVIQDVSSEDGEPLSKVTKGKSDVQLPEEKRHTFVRFAKPLSYCYRRDTLIIYGNAVKATHGETRNETLGNGDGSQSLQSFALKQPPLTFVPAPKPTGVDSTLEIFVNDVQWHEVDTLAGLIPKDRKFITKTDDDGKTAVIFGNGEKGARLPTGMANVKAKYRNGIGKPGNVKAEQVSLLQTRPLGVKSVINPLPASGGADKDNRDQARENAPLAVMSLDRLVSVQDYADFTRMFAGIGKASATRLSDGRRQLVHVTIAGVDDIPIDTTSDLYQNLLVALRGSGDPDLPVQVELRELIVLVLSANVRLAPDYQWEPVVTKIRAALLDDFGFQKRALGQPVLLSEIISVIQNIPGVEYVDVDAFGGVTEQLSLDGIAAAAQSIVKQSSPASRVDVNLGNFESGALHPAQLAIFTDAVPDTLILNQIK
ncbi:MAG TPA: putative baseplate assembly protein, partial [Pyrinomonadaceae bacterium]|nr:putative baseplate assembly protein [Pyrinomonadaceae bacterium]